MRPLRRFRSEVPPAGCLDRAASGRSPGFRFRQEVRAIVGSGGLVVMDEHTCMVEVARFFMGFTQRESCGKCGPCRIGTKRMLELLEKIADGKGEMEDLEKLEETGAISYQARSLCGLGKSAPLPVLSTAQELPGRIYRAHRRQVSARAHVCKSMRVYEIDPDKCKGCTKCARNCPVNAITGEQESSRIPLIPPNVSSAERCHGQLPV